VIIATPSRDIRIAWPASGDALSLRQRAALSWARIARNRGRWNKADDASAERSRLAQQLLTDLELEPDDLDAIARAQHAEVRIPYVTEERGWEARVLPWEVVLSSATRGLRTGPLTVTRQLSRRSPNGKAAKGIRVLYVESAPGELGERYEFAGERRMVRSAAKRITTHYDEVRNPTLAKLEATLKSFGPTHVHLAGFDNHQAVALIHGDGYAAELKEFDGYALSDAAGQLQMVDAEDLAAAFRRAGCAPHLVTCNLWNSGARIAPLLVAAGAEAAVGFQDEFDDALAELFVGTLYKAFADKGELVPAFAAAHMAVRGQPTQIRGSAVVLWSETPLLTHGLHQRVGRLTRGFEERARRVVMPEKVRAGRVDEHVSVRLEAPEEISYALLHNNRDLFRYFYIRNLTPDRIDGVKVHVALHVGVEQCAYRGTFSLTTPVQSLVRAIRVPLTSALARSVDDAMRTTLFVEVTWGDHSLLTETFPVRLAPIDQWEDTDRDRQFLPSFVYPRDPAVARVISMAQRFAVAIRDDPNAGWEGYQSVAPDDAETMYEVDDQVQAIWYSMMYESSIAYINPPPSYAPAAQRVRSPSAVFAEHRGTCIDLALLVASCLEYVEILPVVFLLAGHAFPGYWRSEEVREDFLQRVLQRTTEMETDGHRSTITTREPEAEWVFSGAVFKEILDAIDRDHLVPLESVGLTERRSFAKAIRKGRKHFEVPDEFECMIDVAIARERGVTPLPLQRPLT
jgi:hypothetical protein